MKNRPRRGRRRLAAGLVIAIVLAAALLRLVVASDSPVLRTVGVGQFPWFAIVAAPQGRVFVANTDDGTVSVLDTRDGRLLRTTPVGIQAGPHIWNAAADTRSGQVFFRTGDETLTALNAASGAVMWTTAIQPCSRALAVDSRLAHVFVAECQNGTAQMIDARSGRILANIQVGGHPQDIVVDEQSGRAFVRGGSPSSGDRISLLDAASGRMLRTFALSGYLCPCLTTPLPGAPVLVADGRKPQVFVLDATSARLLRTVPIGMDIYDTAIDPRTGQVFLVGAPPGASGGAAPFSGPGRLVVLDGRSGRVLRRYTLSAPPSAVALDASGRRLVLGFIGRTDAGGRPAGAGQVEVLDAHSLRVLRTIPAGIAPWQIAVDPRTDHAFVVNAAVVPGFTDPTTFPPTYLLQPEGWWQATLRRMKGLLPWLPLQVPPQRTYVNGSVTVLDLTRM